MIFEITQKIQIPKIICNFLSVLTFFEFSDATILIVVHVEETGLSANHELAPERSWNWSLGTGVVN